MFLTLPPRANTLVPLDFSVPIDVNQEAPFKIICGTLANVSTLLIIVGLPHTPHLAGYGGLDIGLPLLPSIEAINAVSSPHTKAPAPRRISILNLKPVPRILSPNQLSSLACLIAIFKRCTAIGYSARI